MKSLQRYLGEQETTLLVTRQHPLSLVRDAVSMLQLVVPLLLAAWGLAGIRLLRGPVADWSVRACFVLVVVFVVGYAWRVLQWEFERVVVTDEKVIHIEGVLQRRIASTPLAKVSEFTVRQPLLGRLFHYGSLVVDVPGGRDQALHGLAFVPDPAGVYRMVSDLARRGRTREGGGKPDPVTIVTTGDVVTEGQSAVETTMQVEGPPPVDPWRLSLDADDSDHTIRIPRVPPPPPSR